ncbi:MAG: FecR domain-containing protein [Rhizomicrobium sp.]
MTRIVSIPDTKSARLEAAGAWRVRIEADEQVSQTGDFLAWLGEPANLEAYASVCTTWDEFEDHQAAAELIAIRRDALDRARRASLQRFVPRNRRFGAIAAMLFVCLFAGIGLSWYWFTSTDYQTGVGERRVVTLDDGSRLSLDSDTAVSVDYSKAARTLVLVRGRARFDVAHDINRPFTVTAGKETVVAVGTSFNIERLGEKVLVTLIEGHVVVKTAAGMVASVAAAPPRPIALAAGQELVVAHNAKPMIAPASLPVATAWESGRLILDNEPLGEAVERMNRYTNKPLIVDPAVAALRVSGVFNAGDVGSFVDAITSYFPVQATTSADDQIVLQKRS